MPKVFGIEHITYLLVVIPFMIMTFSIIKRFTKSDRQMIIIIKFIGIVLLSAIIWNRISIALGRDDFNFLWPDSFCGTSSFVLAVTVVFLKPNHKILHCVAYLGLLGGIVTLIYPDFIDQADSIFYPMTLSGLLHHTIMAFLVFLMLYTGYLKPTIKNWFVLPIGLCVYMTYGLFLITIIGLDDAMYIYEPVLSGTPLNWFVLGLLFVQVYTVFLLFWEVVQKRKKINE